MVVLRAHAVQAYPPGVDPALLWLLIGVGLVVAEAFVLSIVLAMLGVGALAAAGLAALGAPVAAQLAAFSVTSVAMLVLVRPPLRNALDKGGSTERTDPRMLTGSSATVVERVTDDSGQVRLHGELWRARPYAGTAPLEVGAAVSVAAVDGATLLVYSTDLT